MTRSIMLIDIAHARSGDKGDAANVGVIARDAKFYPVLIRELTPARVAEHFAGICFGEVLRYELPNLHALNFILPKALGGGGTVSLKNDAQGKTLSSAMLRMMIEIDDSLLE